VDGRLRRARPGRRCLDLVYTALWSGGGQEAIAAIKSAGTRIQRAADRILSALEQEAGDGAPTPAEVADD
jgi:hypothetical protein